MAVDDHGFPQLPADLTDTSDWHTSPDRRLQALADWADRWGEGIALTLVVSGGLISGTVESHQSFLRGSAEKVREFEAGDENAQKVIDRFANDVFDASAQKYEKDRDDTIEAEADLKEDEDTTPPTAVRMFMHRHIHLSHAWFHVGGAPAIFLGHTRVLLSQVAAWSVGRPVAHYPAEDQS
ncbi:hypothetical protein [Mycolicibacterium sp. XJ775]